MDIVGPLQRSRQNWFIVVVTDYFTKWMEFESYVKIHDKDVQNFVWKYIICHHGLPYEIITDNSFQFTSIMFEGFCEWWRIRLSKSMPRYPQGNRQAAATNKTIIDELKKRLEENKRAWTDDLDGVLWSHTTISRRATNITTFSLAHGMEAMAPAEFNVYSLRWTMMIQNIELNNEILVDNLDTLEEQRDQALLRRQKYQQLAARYYNKRVKNRHFDEGDLVLWKVYQNTSEWKAGNLGANWEGPYVITKIVNSGVYELMTMEGEPILRSWNSMSLELYYYQLGDSPKKKKERSLTELDSTYVTNDERFDLFLRKCRQPVTSVKLLKIYVSNSSSFYWAIFLNTSTFWPDIQF